MLYSLHELIIKLGAPVSDACYIYDSSNTVTGISPLDRANTTQISYLENEKDVHKIKDTRSYYIIISAKHFEKYNKELPKGKVYILIHAEFFQMKDIIIKYFKPKYNIKLAHTAKNVSRGTVYEGAYIECNDCIGNNTIVMPGVVIYQDVIIGANCVIYANTVIGPGTRIGDDCIIGPGCTIGSPPMVYVTHFGKDGYTRANTIGGVRIENNVELGSGVNIDSAIIGDTIIGEGTKIGAHCHIAHDCVIGRHNYIVTQVGMAGWSRTGDNCYLAGQVGVAPNVIIGNNVRVDAKSGVHNNLPDNAHVFGTPAVSKERSHKTFAALKYLPGILKRLRLLEKKVNNGY